MYNVSIHAPTRGATPGSGKSESWIKGFNPRTHTGCDKSSFAFVSDIVCFNPRTHTGCDGSLTTHCALAFCFNPRTHTGCDNFQNL